MKPGIYKGGVNLETPFEIEVSREVLAHLQSPFADYISSSLAHAEAPIETSREVTWLIMLGVRAAVSNITPEVDPELEELMQTFAELSCSEHLDEIVQWFVYRDPPTYNGRDPIWDEYLGVAFPVREQNSRARLRSLFEEGKFKQPSDENDNDPSDFVVVERIDAIKALKLAGREEAASLLESESIHRNHRTSGSTLWFQVNRGELYTPNQIENLLPETSQFDLN